MMFDCLISRLMSFSYSSGSGNPAASCLCIRIDSCVARWTCRQYWTSSGWVSGLNHVGGLLSTIFRQMADSGSESSGGGAGRTGSGPATAIAATCQYLDRAGHHLAVAGHAIDDGRAQIAAQGYRTPAGVTR